MSSSCTVPGINEVAYFSYGIPTYIEDKQSPTGPKPLSARKTALCFKIDFVGVP